MFRCPTDDLQALFPRAVFFQEKAFFLKMKITLSVAALVFWILPLFTASAQKSGSSGFTKVQGYKPRAGVNPGKEYLMQVFTGKTLFEGMFEKVPGAKTPALPDFGKKGLLACISPATSLETSISLEKLLKKDGVLLVYFSVKSGKKSAAATVPFGLFSISLDRSLSGIDYYINGKLVQELRN
jgi:hypothetical protein